jgi:pterin-4a-carbinolamine dehydratase
VSKDADERAGRYTELVAEVARRTGLDFDRARTAAEATVAVLARALDRVGRQRLFGAAPAEPPAGDPPAGSWPQPRDLLSFLDQLGRLAPWPPEQPRYQGQAMPSAVADQDRDLIEALDSPGYGGTATAQPLSAGELHTALSELPQWSGDRQELSRTVVLPPESLDLLLDRLELLSREVGRGPRIGRQGPDSALLVVRTDSAAVTALDVDLARGIDAAIDEARAGLAPTE